MRETTTMHPAAGPPALVLLRHGTSTGNTLGLFTGLLDVPLDVDGRRETGHAARLMTAVGLRPRIWYCSPMRRTRQTAALLRTAMPRVPRVIRYDWRLSERHYGALTGRSKREVRAEYGGTRFLRWRRSVDTAPPPLTADDRDRILRQGIPLVDDPRFGASESLAQVIDRVRACYDERILPDLFAGTDVLVIAHGNSLRAVCAVLDGLTAEEIEALNVPTGQPLVYRIDTATGRPVVRGGTYLDPSAHDAADRIAAEGGT